jgi:hypothetical protein
VVEMQKSRRLQHDGRTEDTSGAYQKCAQPGDDPSVASRFGARLRPRLTTSN